MKRTVILVAAVALAAFVLGIFLAAVADTLPPSWLAPQDATGRPSRLIGLLALGPIILVGLVVLVVRGYRAAVSTQKKRSQRK